MFGILSSRDVYIYIYIYVFIYLFIHIYIYINVLVAGIRCFSVLGHLGKSDKLQRLSRRLPLDDLGFLVLEGCYGMGSVRLYKA